MIHIKEGYTSWTPPIPRIRNLSISKFKDKASINIENQNNFPKKIDLTKWCSPVTNQFNLGSCSAHAANSIVEYLANKEYQMLVKSSSLFLYKTTRNLLKVTGDTGAYPRNVINALVQYGILLDKYWPYSLDGIQVNPNWDKEPSLKLYDLAKNYGIYNPICHDFLDNNTSTHEVLFSLKKHISLEIPVMFSFWRFSSSVFTNIPGAIPYPGELEKPYYGHTIAAFGFDDNKIICNTKHNIKTKGALLIKNSKGVSWGNEGYGWLPYQYVLDKLAYDFWSFLFKEISTI